MESFSSEMLPRATRASAWNALYSKQLNSVDFTPADRQGFAAQLSLGRLGPIQFARMHTNRSNIERTRQHIVNGSPRLYSFLLQARGSSVFNHCGQEARRIEGAFALCDSYAQHNFTIHDDRVVVLLRVVAPTVNEHRPCPAQLQS